MPFTRPVNFVCEIFASKSMGRSGILLVRAAFAYGHESLKDLPSISLEEGTKPEIKMRIIDERFRISDIMEESGLERLFNKLVNACQSIGVPTYEASLKVVLSPGDEHNRLKVSIIWIQERRDNE